MEKLRFGIIGCSKIAIRSVMPSIVNSTNAELSIIGSRTLDKAEKTARMFELENFGSYEDVLKSNVDAIYISLPIALHEEWSIKASKAGKHVLSEKSSTTNFASAKNMVQEAK